MKLIKYDNYWNDPLADVSQWFDRALGQGLRFPEYLQSMLEQPARGFRLDLYEDGNSYYVVAELPGVAKEDVQVELENAVLTITAKRQVGSNQSASQAEYSRTVTVADNVDPQRVQAQLRDGLLKVTLPKAEHKQPRAITVD